RSSSSRGSTRSRATSFLDPQPTRRHCAVMSGPGTKRARHGLWAGLAVLALAALAASLVGATHAVASTADLVTWHRGERMLAARVLVLPSEADAAERTFLLAPAAEHLKPIDAARHELGDLLAQLSNSDPGSGSLHARIVEVRELAEARMSNIDTSLRL